MKKLLLLLLLLTAALPTAAQDATIEVPLNSNGYELDVSPDGAIAAVYENAIILDNVVHPFNVPIRLINLETGDQIGFLAGQTDFASDVAFSPDGTRIASFHWNGDLHLWDVATQDRLQTFETLLIGGGRVQFLADGQTVVILAGGINSRLLFLDTETGAITRIVGQHFSTYNNFRGNYTAPPASLDITYVAFAVNADSTLAAVATANDEVILFDLERGRESTVRPAAEQFGRLSIRRLELTEDGSRLVYVVQGDPTMTYIYDIEADEEVFAEEIGSFSWDYREGRFAWASREDSIVHVVDLETMDVLAEVPLEGSVRSLTTVALVPDAVIVGGLQSELEEGNVLVKVALETSD